MENEAQEETVETSGEEQAPASNVKPGMDWYVIQAYSGYENKVKLSLEERIRQAGMEDLFGEILIPKEPELDGLPQVRHLELVTASSEPERLQRANLF